MMDLEDILKKLGWDDGFQIPIANAENKALEEEVAKLSLRKNKAKNQLDRANSRLEGLREHFKYIHQENEQNQKLITAHRQQYETVEHCYHLVKSERANVQVDMKRMSKELEELDRRQETKKSDLQKNMAKAERMKTETEWDAEALKAWEETLKKRDDDIELIKKFSMEDAIRYNDLEARRQLLQAESDRRTKASAKMMADLRNNEMVIDRTGKMLKQQDIEREALIKQWKEAVKMLQRRDEDVVKAQEKIVTTQELAEKHKEKLDEENEFLRNEQRNNHELDLEMESMNALNSRLRRDYNDLTQDYLMLNSELQSLRREAASSAQHLEDERMRLKNLEQTTTQKEGLVTKFEEDTVRLRQKVEELKGSSMNSAEKIRSVEKMIEAEEKLHNIYVSDTEKINNLLFRFDKAHKEQIAASKILEMDLNNANLFCNQLRKHIQVARKELEKIKEVVYNMEYRIDEFEQRLLRLECESTTDANSEETEKNILEMEEALTNYKAVQHTLQAQVDRLREEMNRLNIAIALDKEQLAILKDKCEQHQLENETSKKHIAAAMRSTQEKQVEENVMRLRINQIEKDMKREEKMIFTMEKLRLNLDQVMRERQLEINTRQMIMQVKRRNLDEDKGRLRGEIALRRVKIEQQQKKYHILLMSLGKDEEGQPVSISSFKIKHAQEKFMLQKEGDMLDQKIKTAEKEIVAMENTLKMVNLTNAAFKNSLSPIKDDDKEVQEMKSLEQLMVKANNVLREYRKKLSNIKEEIQVLQGQVDEKEEMERRVKEKVGDMEREFELVEKQEMDKAEKLQRTECNIKRLLKKLSKKDLSKYNRDFEIRALRDRNNEVLNKLLEMYGLYPEMVPLINRYANIYGFRLPEKKISWSSSSSSIQFSMETCSSRVSMGSRTSSSRSASEISVKKVDLSLKL